MRIPDPFAPSHGRPAPRGRAAAGNPRNRFERLHVEPFPPEPDEAADVPPRQVPTRFLRDAARSALARNDSPDLPFRFGLNPYRGCEHGCAYCYARPTHEYLGFSAGLDFETRIVVKPDLPRRLAETFRRRSWRPQPIALSGVTDPYQPVERRLGLTRACLEVCLRHRNPVALVTKNALVVRDLDLLGAMAALDLVAVHLSVTSLRDDVVAAMEPRTSRPARRLAAIERLAAAGVPVGVMVAPIVPGLTDEEVPAILAAAAGAGARWAGYSVLRLPGTTQEVFTAWLERTFPERAGKVLARVRALHGGTLHDPRPGLRLHGEGVWAETLAQLVRTTCRRLGLDAAPPRLTTSHFRRGPDEAQLDLFG